MTLLTGELHQHFWEIAGTVTVLLGCWMRLCIHKHNHWVVLILPTELLKNVC